MLRQFRNLVDATRAMIAEAKAELAEEKLEAISAEATRISYLKTRFAEAGRLERFGVALAAPYRQAFSSELRDAREQDRPPVYMLCVDVAEHEVRSWKKLLERDFDVRDRESAETAFRELTEVNEPIDEPDRLALWAARYCHLVSGAAAVGYIDRAEAVERLAPAADRVAAGFSGWADYSERFLAGERAAAGSNVLGRKALQIAVKALLSDEYSPWAMTSWPEPHAVGRPINGLARRREA